MNPYTVLGVEDNASKEVCKKAYRKLCAMYHPDNNGGNPELFCKCQTAWNTINKEGTPLVSYTRIRTHLSHVDLFHFKSVTVTS